MGVETAYLVAGIICVVAVLLWFKRSPIIEVLRSARRKHESAALRVRVGAAPLSELRRLPACPLLELAPDVNLSSTVLCEALTSYCEKTFTTLLRGDNVNVAVEGISIATSRSDIIYTFSQEALDLYRKGDAIIPVHEASGKFLPLMQDRSGKIIEQAKGAVTMAPRIAEICSLVISTAHIISGVDLVKRLERLKKSVDVLVAGRGIDQDARLERLFTQARGLLRLDLSEARLDLLFDIRYQLYELRQVWAREIKHSMTGIDKLPARHVAHPTSWLRRGNREGNALKDLDSVRIKLESSRVALLLDSALAMTTGTVTDLQENVLIRERAQWETIRTGTQAAGKLFRRAKPSAAFAEIFKSICEHSAFISGVLGSSRVNLVESPNY
jgi:hypothetical protein